MKDIKIHEIKQAFGEITFGRGLEYFEYGYVEMGVKKGNKLMGTVRGAAPVPYKVRIEITDEIHSRCTCPVGGMCKHGVALILQWINKKSSFLDVDQIMVSLEEKSKNELLNIINLMVEEDPLLASKLVSSRELSENKVNLEAISRRIDHSSYGFIDYYAVSGVVNELDKVKRIADTLRSDGNFKEAVEVYLLLIEKGVNIYDEGIDDSNGELGDFIIECVEDFSNCMEIAGEEEKLALIYRIIRIVEEEDYGLNTENMLFTVATENNVYIIEEELLKRVPEGSDSDYHSKYQRKKIIDLLYHLYRNLDLYEHSLKAIIKAGLKNKDDHLRIAETLMEEGRLLEAFEYVKKGEQLKEERSHALDELYFSFLNNCPRDKWTDVKEDEIMAIALKLLSSHWRVKKIYPPIKNVFIKMGKYDELISAVKTKCRDDIAITILLYDDHIDDAIERANLSKDLYPSTIIEVAKAAKDKGKNKDAVDLTFKALKQGAIETDETFVELMKLLVEDSEDKKLEEAIDYVWNVSMAKILATALLERNHEYALRLLERFLADLGKAEINWYAKKLNAKYAIKLCKSWISQTVNRSHVYYDDSIDILKVLKEIMGEAKFRIYIHEFIVANKGKKKLLDKIKGINLM